MYSEIGGNLVTGSSGLALSVRAIVDRPRDEQFFVVVHTATRTERNVPMTITRKQDLTATELGSRPPTAKPSGSQ
jgi:hypothetical protein